MTVGVRWMANVLSLACSSIFTVSAWGAPPPAVFKAVDVPGTTAFSTSVLDLNRARYVEEEFYVSGVANRYRIANPLETAQVIDGDHPYVSRVIVRRPIRRQDFNGTVVVEWYNVTGGQDADIVFAATHDHLLREGFAFVAVSAQLVGVNTLRKWSPARYGALGIEAPNVDPTSDKRIDAAGDVLSWDIYGQVGAALSKGAGLGGLKPKRLIAVGESQSAARLTSYYNSIQPLHQVYDGFLTYDRAGPLRSDIGVKSISVGTEFTGNFAAPPADSKDHRWWEVAGASHMSTNDLEYMDPVHKRDGVFRDAAGNPQTVTQFIGLQSCQKTPLFSRVPTGHVLNMGLEQLIAWIQKGTAPVTASRLTRDASGKLARDADGRVAGGVRLPAYDAPVAENSGANSGPGFCVLAGYHLDFPQEELCKRYGNHDGYVKRMQEVAGLAERGRFLLPADALKTRADAAKFSFSCRGGE